MSTKITTKTQYAVAAMIEIAQSEGLISIAKISSNQSISFDYMSVILSELQRKKLIMSIRGRRGGYKIARPIDDISIVDIMEAIGEKIKITRCNGREGSCNGSKIKCTAHNMWKKLEDNMSEYLSSMTLKDILNIEGNLDDLTKCNHLLIRSI